MTGRLRASVDGRDAGSAHHELAHQGQWLRLRAVTLAAGRSTVRLAYDGSAPALGPIALTPPQTDAAPPVTRLAPAAAGRLCDGRRYDWIEALG
jgi:hypothetical protein